MAERHARFGLDRWYRWLVVVGAAGALAALIVDTRSFAKMPALLLSLNVLSVGIGEWINHSGEQLRRRAKLAGTAFNVLGFALGTLALFQIERAA